MKGFILWQYRVFRERILAIPGRVIAIIFFLFLLSVPVFVDNPFVLKILVFSAIFAIYATSWDLLAGYTGQINLGHALFFGVSAYTVGLLSTNYSGLSPWLTIPAGSIAAVIVGLIVGIPALRLRGFYLSLVTLAFPIILVGIVLLFQEFTGGEVGLYGIRSLSSSRKVDYYIINLIMGLCVLAMWKLTDPKSKIIRFGVVLHAIREDEISARVSGIKTTKYKLLAYAFSGLFAGIAGGLYAHVLRIVGPSTLEFFFSFQAILWTVFGGMGSIYGPVVGVYILYVGVEVLRMNPMGEQIRFVLISLILILTLLFMPQGIAIWIKDKIEVTCQRCKLVNYATRDVCRACGAPLRLERED